MCYKKILLVAIAGLLAAALNGSLLAQGNNCPGCSEPDLTLIPKSFGPQSHTSWKQGVGCPGCTPDPNTFGLFFQRDTDAAPAVAHASAQMEGFDGQVTGTFNGTPPSCAPGAGNPCRLAFDHRTLPTFNDVCSGSAVGSVVTPGSPRWSIRFGAPFFNKFILSCGERTTGGLICSNLTCGATGTSMCPPGWEHCEWNPVARPMLLGQSGTILSIAIIVDDPDSSAVLDNIIIKGISNRFGVTTTMTWGQPSDNNKNFTTP